MTTISIESPGRTIVDLFTLSTGQRLRTWPPGESEVTSIAFVPNEDCLAIGTMDGRVGFYPFRR